MVLLAVLRSFYSVVVSFLYSVLSTSVEHDVMRHQLPHQVYSHRIFFNWGVLHYFSNGVNRQRIRTFIYSGALNKTGLKPDLDAKD
jgi:hypothetical protein